jgi:hypothetical protein
MMTLNLLQLPDDLFWHDEFSWSAVRQSSDLTLTGALIVEEAAQQAGRPITLIDGWASRAVVEQLYLLVQQPGQVHTLVMGGQTYTVMFRHSEGALTATPLLPVTDPAPTDPYLITLRLMVV